MNIAIQISYDYSTSIECLVWDSYLTHTKYYFWKKYKNEASMEMLLRRMRESRN